jgi:spore coat protein CotF
MSTERLENIEKALLSCVESQTSDLKNVDAHELGEVIDMIKDLSEAIYY